jgi:hypothetical protein
MRHAVNHVHQEQRMNGLSMFDSVTGSLAGRHGGGAKARGGGDHADPRRLLNVDMRSGRGRRYRDIVELLIAEFPGADAVRLRELASLKYGLEQIQGLMVGGDVSAADNVVRLANLVSRRERDLRRHVVAAAAVKETRPLHERLMGAGSSGGRAGEAKARTSSSIADAPFSRVRRPASRPAPHADDDSEGDDG